jgi:hypothetical protein
MFCPACGRENPSKLQSLNFCLFCGQTTQARSPEPEIVTVPRPPPMGTNAGSKRNSRRMWVGLAALGVVATFFALLDNQPAGNNSEGGVSTALAPSTHPDDGASLGTSERDFAQLPPYRSALDDGAIRGSFYLDVGRNVPILAQYFAAYEEVLSKFNPESEKRSVRKSIGGKLVNPSFEVIYRCLVNESEVYEHSRLAPGRGNSGLRGPVPLHSRAGMAFGHYSMLVASMDAGISGSGQAGLVDVLEQYRARRVDGNTHNESVVLIEISRPGGEDLGYDQVPSFLVEIKGARLAGEITNQMNEWPGNRKFLVGLFDAERVIAETELDESQKRP